jgi:CRISPR-associated endonuclease Csn1
MEKKNELIVGLDIGSNSVGWAVVGLNEDESGKVQLEKIHGIGSRIIPMGPELKDFEQGNAISKNATRRQKRSMRRNNQRYKLRRSNLERVLKLLGAWPDGLGGTPSLGAPMLTPMHLYGLRARAVEEPVEITELGRVLYHMNQRRGYKDIGDLMDEMQGKETDAKEDSKVSREVKKVLITDVLTEDDKGKKEIFTVTVQIDGVLLVGSARSKSFLDLIGTEEYVEIKTRKTAKGETVEFYRTSVTEWKKDKDKLDVQLEESGLHPGQFFFKEFQSDPLNRIRERIVLRERYRAEFNAIWERQAREHAVLRDPAIRDQVVLALISNNQKEQKVWLQRDLGRFVRDYVIYYQRPLRSQRSSIGQCRFETGRPKTKEQPAIPGKPVMPVSSPIYQLFRIWQQVNNIKVFDRELKELPLTADERVRIVHYLIQHAELKSERLMKELGRGSEERESNLRANLPGHQTLDKLRKHLKGTALWDRLLIEATTLKGIRDSMLFRIWHILYSIGEEENRRKAFEALPELSNEVVEVLIKVRYERKHGAVSARAAMRIIPLMQCGEDHDASLISERDQQRLQKFIDGEDIPGMDNDMRATLSDLTTLEHFQGLAYWKAATVIYGDHRASAQPTFTNADEVRSLQRGFLRNPVVEQVVNETLMVVRDIWKTYGRPTSIRVELARELRQNQKQRQETHKRNGERDKARKWVREELTAKHGRPKPSRKDIEKYELWVQQKHQCIYSGKVIEASQLFDTREVDIDHIIPQSKYYDDSVQNKVLCMRTENAGANGKNKLLAAPYMKAKGPVEWEAYLKRVNGWGLSRSKRQYLLAEEVPVSFINRQLQETRYIGTEVRKHLERFAPVHTTLGIVTDLLKDEWGLNKVYKEVLIPRFQRLEKITGRTLITEAPGRNGHKDWRIEGFEKRIDHRHHALDALVVALTRQGYIQRLSNVNQIDATREEKEAMRKPTWFPLPHPELRSMVKDQLERTIPSIKNRQRLLTKSANITKYLKDPVHGILGEKPQRTGKLHAVRGPLHDEQPMGEIREQRRWPLKKVISWLENQPDAIQSVRAVVKGDPDYAKRFIAHEHERAMLEAHLAKYDGTMAKMKKALKKDPITNAKNELVEHITVFETKFAVVRTLSPMFSTAMVDKIIDRSLRKRITAHLKAFGDDPKKAFTGDGLHILNDGQTQKLYKVRCVAFDTTIADTKGFTRLEHKNDPNTKQHVKKGDNYALVVYEHLESGAREFDVVSFYDAVARKVNGLDIVDPKPGYRHFILRKNDLVYVPRPGEELHTVDWNDAKAVGDRLYRTVKFSGDRHYFLPVRTSSPVTIAGAQNEYFSQNCLEKIKEDSPETHISKVCMPLNVNRIGSWIREPN